MTKPVRFLTERELSAELDRQLDPKPEDKPPRKAGRPRLDDEGTIALALDLEERVMRDGSLRYEHAAQQIANERGLVSDDAAKRLVVRAAHGRLLHEERRAARYIPPDPSELRALGDGIVNLSPRADIPPPERDTALDLILDEIIRLSKK